VEQKKILIIDFDGVICDSIRECFIVAYNAYLQNEGKNKGSRINFKAPRALREYFFRNRHLVRPAREYFILFKSFGRDGQKRLSSKQFKIWVKKCKDDSFVFEKNFYDTRRHLRSRYKKRWFRLNPIYPEAIKGIRELSRFFKIYISTTKDKKSVKMLLNEKILRLPENRLFTKESGLSKAETARRICKNNKCKPVNAWFIDDNIAYLEEVSRMGVKCGLAHWGYSGEDAVRLARSRNYFIFKNFREVTKYLTRGEKK